MAKEIVTPPPVVDPQYCCYRLRIEASKIHGWGIYAAENIPANRKVIEYRGEKIGPREAKRRGHTPYLFVLDDRWTLDGGVGGSGAQYINHSCQPNLVSRIMKGHIIYMSLRNVRKGEELTIDYNYDDTDETMPCRCGRSNCRGIINRNV